MLGVAVAVAALVAAALIAPGAVGAAYAQTAPPPLADTACPAAALGEDCVYHVTRSLDVGDTVPHVVRIDGDTGRVYVANRPHAGSMDINYSYLRIYDSVENGNALIKEIRFNGTNSRIPDIEINARTGELHVLHVGGIGDVSEGWAGIAQWLDGTPTNWDGTPKGLSDICKNHARSHVNVSNRPLSCEDRSGKAALTTISLATSEITSTVQLNFTSVWRGSPETIDRFTLYDLELDTRRDLAYVASRLYPILVVDTENKTLLPATRTFPPASGVWDADAEGVSSTALAVDEDSGIVYASVRAGDRHVGDLQSWGVAALSFEAGDGSGGATAHYRQLGFLPVSPTLSEVRSMHVDADLGKVFALYYNHTAISFGLNESGHPVDAAVVHVRTPEEHGRSPDRTINDILLDADRDLLYVSLFDWTDPRVIVLDARTHARVGVASGTSQMGGMGLDASDGDVYVLPSWAPSAYVIEGEAKTDLQRKIDEAAAGSTVLVEAGTYGNAVLDINKSLTLASESGQPGSAVFTGYSRVEVEADDVAIRGLLFRDMDCLPGYGASLVEIRTHNAPRNNVTIENNVFTNTCHAAIQKEGRGALTNIVIADNVFESIGLKLPPGWTEPIDTGGENEYQIMHGAIGLSHHNSQDPVGASITNNYINGTSAAGIRVFKADGVAISGNYIENTPASAIGLAHLPKNALITNNTIVNANNEPDLDYLAGRDGTGEPDFYKTIYRRIPYLQMDVLDRPYWTPAPDAAINVWSNGQNINVTGNTIRASDGAFTACTGVCAFESDGVVRNGGRNIASAAVDVSSRIWFNNNVVHAHDGPDNGGVLVRSNTTSSGMLDATGNYYIGVANRSDIGAAKAGRVDLGSELTAVPPGAGTAPAPYIINVSTSPQQAEYGPGETATINVLLSGPVIVSGAPALPLDVGLAEPALAAYSGYPIRPDGTLTFAYAVGEGHASDRLGTASEIELPTGGSIRGYTGRDANLTMPAPGSGRLLNETSSVTILNRTLATADAAFTGDNTIRIAYSAPLGAPAGHEGPVYGQVVTADGTYSILAGDNGVSGLGTDTHTVRFGGDGVPAGRNGTIALAAPYLEGQAGGVSYRFIDDAIRVGAGAIVRTAAPDDPAPGLSLDPDAYDRVNDATPAGDAARPWINVTAFAADTPGPGAANIDVTFPAAGESVRMIASFAEVSFPPNVTATSVPADGVLELYVSDPSDLGEPAAVTARIAEALDVSAAGLEVNLVEVGGNETLIRFDMPVRILLAGQADGRAFYINSSDARVVPIDVECAGDDTQAVHAQLGGAGECQADSGGDKVIYTYHLTLFGTASGDSPLVSAVKAAPAGGTVRVQPGTYAAERLVVNKSLTIEPADPANPPIFTNYSHIVVRPSADGPITISGLVFMDTTRTSDGGGPASIVVESLAGSDPGMPVTIRNNTFGNTCGSGIRATAETGAPPVSGLTVQGNVFYDIGMNAASCTSPPTPGRADAMVLGRHNASAAAGSGTAQLNGLAVMDNYIFGTTYTGIRIAGAAGAVVEGNHIQDVPDDGIRVLPSTNVTVLGNTIIDANQNPYVNGTAHDGTAGAAVEVWSGSDDVAVALNRISGTAGAFSVCAGMCDPGADAADGTGGGLVAVDRAPIGSADGNNDVRFNHNVLAASNTAPLVANNAGGSLDARANYYPGYADTAADRIGERVEYLPVLGAAGPVRIGVVVADAPGSPIRSIGAAVAAGFGAGAFEYSAAQASAGGLVGIEPVVAAMGSPDVSEAAAHNETLEALRTGAIDDGRMIPVLEDSLSRAMALYDEGGADGLAAISAMNATYGHYPFVNDRNGTIVAHGSNPSLVGDTGVAVRLAGGPDRLPALYDFGSSDSMTGIRGHPDVAWKWWTYEFANPAAGGATQSKRSIIALHPGPDGTAGNADDLIFGAGHYPSGAPAHLVVAAGDAVASVADLSGGSGVVVSPTSTATTPARLAASGDALFRLALPDTAAASVIAGLLDSAVDRVVVLNDSASLHSQSMAAALSSPASDARAGNRTVVVVPYDSSGTGWAGPAMAAVNAAISSGSASSASQTAVVYTGRAGALAELNRTNAASSTPADARWYATGDLARTELGMPAPDLARRTNLTAVSQFAEPNAAVDARLSLAGVSLDASTRGPAYAAYDAAFLLGRSIAAAAGTGFADGSMPPAADVAAGMAEAARGYDTSALGGRLMLDANGDLALPDRYAVSSVNPDGSWIAAPGGPRAAPGSCGVDLGSDAPMALGTAMPGQRSMAGTQTVLNTGTRAYENGSGIAISATPWEYDDAGTGGPLDAGLTTYRVLPDGSYAAATEAGAALPGSPPLLPGEEVSVQFRLDLTSMRTLAAGSISQTVTYSVSCVDDG